MLKKLRQQVYDTVLMDEQFKKTLLDLKEWDENIIKLLNEFFKKYGPIEKKIMKDVISKMGTFYVKAIQSIELEARKKEIKELKKI